MLSGLLLAAGFVSQLTISSKKLCESAAVSIFFQNIELCGEGEKLLVSRLQRGLGNSLNLRTALHIF